MFRAVLCPSSGVFRSTRGNGICHTGLLTACELNQEGPAVPSWSCSQAVWHIPLPCLQWKTPDYGQRNCPKHVGCYSKNKFEKLVHLVGFIIRIYHDARSLERHAWKHVTDDDRDNIQTMVVKNEYALLCFIVITEWFNTKYKRTQRPIQWVPGLSRW